MANPQLTLLLNESEVRVVKAALLVEIARIGTIDGGRVTYYSGSSRRPALQGGLPK
jgi:hypothetical protein